MKKSKQPDLLNHDRKSTLVRVSGLARLVCVVAIFFVQLSLTMDAQGQTFGNLSQQAVNRNTLRDVLFFDNQTGWAVGDRGTILRTTNGGQSWIVCGTSMPLASNQGSLDPRMQGMLDRIRQGAGTTESTIQQTVMKNADCRLNSVSFVDPVHGWACGGNSLPGSGEARGMVLVTKDGGTTWLPMAFAGAPVIQRLKMDTLGQGWGIGRSGFMHRGGQYLTADSGRSWSSFASGNEKHDFIDGDRTGEGWIALASDGTPCRIIGSKVEAGVVTDRQARPLRKIRMQDSKTGWAVGDGGTVLRTSDAGMSWQSPKMTDEAKSLLTQFDLRALHIGAEQIVMAGAPGTRILTLDPATGTVTAAPSGVSATVNDIHFLADGNGWCVGSDETILHSADHGKTWEVQRGGRSDQALLAICFDDGDAAWEVLARYASDERMATTVVRVLLNSHSAANQVEFEEAGERIGAIDSRGLPTWTLLQKAAPDLNFVRQQLATLIRQTRPQVVVCNSPHIQLSDGSVIDTHSWLDSIIQDAGKALAATPGTSAGTVTPWQVSRLATRDPVTNGDWTVENRSWLTRVGRNVADQALISRALAGLELISPERQSYRMTRYILARTGATNDGLFAELATDAGRKLTELNPHGRMTNLNDINRAMHKSSQLNRLANIEINSPGDVMVWREQTAKWVALADEELAGIWLVQLSAAAREKGNLQLSAEALVYLVSSYPKHPLAPAAALWLARYFASDETRIASDLSIQPWSPDDVGQFLAIAGSAKPVSRPVVIGDATSQMTVWTPNTPGIATLDTTIDDKVFRQVAAIQPEDLQDTPEKTLRSWWQNSAGKLTGLASRYPELSEHTQMQLAQANTVRLSAGWETSAAQYKRIMENDNSDAITGRIAVRELNIQSKPEEIRQAVWHCPRIEKRPNLDGVLNDDSWSQLFSAGKMRMLAMRPPNSDQPSRTDYLLFACDDEFLFFAGRCSQATPAKRSVQEGQARQRDSLDRESDRVLFGFDTDRDGAWPLWFGLSPNGQLIDGCGYSTGWNPQWFVATQQEESAWTFEGAISWKQFGLEGPPGESGFWGLAVERLLPGSKATVWDVPGAGFQSQSYSFQTPLVPVHQSMMLGFGN